MKKTVQIEGMSCNHCVHAVSKALTEIDEIEVESVQIGSATFSFEDAELDMTRVRDAIEAEGYTVVGELTT